MNKITAEQISDVRMYTSMGWTQARIAARLKISVSQVHRIQRQTNVRVRDAELTPADRADITRMGVEGDGVAKIARTLHLPEHRVASVLHEAAALLFRHKNLTLLQKRMIRRDFRLFEVSMARKFHCPLRTVVQLLRRRNHDY